jgi:hypothetical protein
MVEEIINYPDCPGFWFVSELKKVRILVVCNSFFKSLMGQKRRKMDDLFFPQSLHSGKLTVVVLLRHHARIFH